MSPVEIRFQISNFFIVVLLHIKALTFKVKLSCTKTREKTKPFTVKCSVSLISG